MLILHLLLSNVIVYTVNFFSFQFIAMMSSVVYVVKGLNIPDFMCGTNVSLCFKPTKGCRIELRYRC